MASQHLAGAGDDRRYRFNRTARPLLQPWLVVGVAIDANLLWTVLINHWAPEGVTPMNDVPTLDAEVAGRASAD